MKKLFMLMMMVVGSTVGQAYAQEKATPLSEVYQTGLPFASKELAVSLPDRFMFTDRTEKELFAATSVDSNKSRMAAFSLPNLSAAQAQEAIKAFLAKKGKVSDSAIEPWGETLRRSTLRCFVEGNPSTYQVAHFDAKPNRVDVLRIEWPLDQNQTFEQFKEKDAKNFEAVTEKTVESFFRGQAEIGSGLVYNGILSDNRARITLKLPPSFVYTSASKDYVQAWMSKDEPEKTLTLGYREFPKGFTAYRDMYPAALQKSFKEGGLADSEGKSPGTVDFQRFDVKDGTWDVIYISTVPAIKKGKLGFVSFLNWQRFKEASPGLIVSLNYREPVVTSDNRVEDTKKVDKMVESYAPVFDTFEVVAKQ